MPTAAQRVATRLNRERESFKAFLAARLGSAAEAEDVLQLGLLKAVQHADTVEDDAKLTAWFYQLLRNALIDHYRSRASTNRRHDALGETIAALEEDVTAARADWEPQLCQCLGGVVDTLTPRSAELLRRVDLDGQSVQDAARALKMSPNSASVTLHRARKELRARLERFCGDCAEGACLDCDCPPPAKKSK